MMVCGRQLPDHCSSTPVMGRWNVVNVSDRSNPNRSYSRWAPLILGLLTIWSIGERFAR